MIGDDTSPSNRAIFAPPKSNPVRRLGDSTKARERLGWAPTIGFDDLVREMMREDLKEAERDDLCRREGFDVAELRE